jgi:murein DD-endopeptidase MepM/ murein hydrolase activator NlpD
VLLVPAAKGETLSFQTTKTRLLIWLVASFLCVGLVAVQAVRSLVHFVAAPVEVAGVHVDTGGPDYESLWRQAMEENQELRAATQEQAQEFAEAVDRFRDQVTRFFAVSGLPMEETGAESTAIASAELTDVSESMDGRGGPLPGMGETLPEMPIGLQAADDHLNRLSALTTMLTDLNLHLARRQSLLQRTPLACPIESAWTLTDGFGMRRHPISHQREFHRGIDMAAPTGTPVVAPADGVVVFAGRQFGYGRMVQISHGAGLAPGEPGLERSAFVTRFGHLSRIIVHEGDEVHRGDVIGRVGSSGYSTGSHLHYEVWQDGRPVNPVPFVSEP